MYKKKIEMQRLVAGPIHDNRLRPLGNEEPTVRTATMGGTVSAAVVPSPAARGVHTGVGGVLVDGVARRTSTAPTCDPHAQQTNKKTSDDRVHYVNPPPPSTNLFPNSPIISPSQTLSCT
jgi:hypothetical protein